jgi:hypothetical protein
VVVDPRKKRKNNINRYIKATDQAVPFAEACRHLDLPYALLVE